MHHARLKQSVDEVAEAGGTIGVVIHILYIPGIEPHRIGHVEHFPAQFQVLALVDLPSFRQAHIDIERSRPPQLVALP